MNTTRRLCAATLLVTLAVTLSGCNTQPQEDQQTPSPTATDEPVETTRLALGELVVSPAGLGPLLVGEPLVDEPEETALVVWDPTGCITAGVPGVEGEPWAGYWKSTYEDPAVPEDRTFTVVTMGGIKDGPIARVVVYSDELATDEGVHVGSTIDDVLAAYPDAVPLPDPLVSDVYVVAGPTGSLAIEVAIENPDAPDYWDPAQIDTVMWMVVFSSADEVVATAGSDTIGPCPV